MQIKCIWEHNGNDSTIFCEEFIGAFTRGKTKEIAFSKIKSEIVSYQDWLNREIVDMLEPVIIQEYKTSLQVCDADTEVIFDNEKTPFNFDEYYKLKDIALKSAKDFLNLYESVPDKNISSLSQRKTFYGELPLTAKEMYEHTKSVNYYYFGEIDINVSNEGSIYECRKRGFDLVEKNSEFLNNQVVLGSYNELWSLKKVLRRFIWHDRIHAKAMYRMCNKTFGDNSVDNIFKFII